MSPLAVAGFTKVHQRIGRRGASAVEMAFILPVFLLLVFAMMELGRGLMVYQLITNASRIGARQGSIELSQAAPSARDYLNQFGLDSATTEVMTESNPSTVQVDIQVKYEDIAWLPPFFLKDATISSATVMLSESLK